ncbi:putative mannan endo- -beta-mannosidase protein [Eutypa lata UCREL1]|uniref:Putative mannan endo--beta-mannosidase protein n=1 Tax=Eutypa lata (strain UCR-EL1) TaxID=1287681 RepID=M7SZU6_EUTLA|nr:putative mannan endo- -beta-mannosidase protein [Eutypa lata UCREL1]
MSIHRFRGTLKAGLAFAAGITTAVCQNNTRVFEAEDAVLNGTTVDTATTGFSGTGYVTGFEDATDKVTFEVTSESLTLYDISIRYAGIYGEKRTSLILNGGSTSEVVLAEGDTWANVSGGQVLLEAGDNTIDLLCNWGWYLIDYISLTPSEPREPHEITAALVDPDADDNAYALYNYLVSIYGKNILSGQQDLSYADWITENIGKTPAVVSVDLMDYSPSRVEFQGDVATTIEDALTHHERGGIVSVLWHWNAPTGLYNTDDEPWWSGFYTEATDFNVATALADTTNANYTLVIRDIDAIAEQLKRLQDAGVPVLFRPLHEAEGGWFWWGAQGAEPAKQLWNLLFDRLTNHHGIHNLIWMWNSLAVDWYPGSSAVDILSADVYAEGHGPLSTQYNQLIDLGEDKKLIAAAEVGSAPLPDQLQAYQADWVYFAVWGSGYIDNAEWNPVDVLTEIYNHDYVLTLDEIQGWAGK